MNINLTTTEMTELTNSIKTTIEQANPDAEKVTVVKSYSEQKKEFDDRLTELTELDDNKTKFNAFCEYGRSVNWAFNVNRTLLCGKKDGSVIGVGMTDAEYTALNNKLSSLSALLLDFISADMAFKNRPTNTTKDREKAMTELVKRCENSAFTVFKSIKTTFNLDSKCTRWDISTLAYLTISVKYRDRTNLSAGWTFGQCSNIALLNKILRLDSAVKAEGERIKALRNKYDDTKVKSEVLDCLKEQLTALENAQTELEKIEKVGGITRVKKD